MHWQYQQNRFGQYIIYFSKRVKGPWRRVSGRKRIDLAHVEAEVEAYQLADKNGWLQTDATGTKIKFTRVGFRKILPDIYPPITPYINEFSKIAVAKGLGIGYRPSDFYLSKTATDLIEEYIQLKSAGYKVDALNHKESIAYRQMRQFFIHYAHTLRLPVTVVPSMLVKLVRARLKAVSRAHTTGNSTTPLRKQTHDLLLDERFKRRIEEISDVIKGCPERKGKLLSTY